MSPCKMALTARDPAGPVVAAFDFDGTLTRGDSLIPWLRGGLGAARLGWALARTSPALAAWQIGRISNEAAKLVLLRHTVAGRSRGELARWTEAFLRDTLPGLLDPRALRRLAAHQAAGHRCVMVSASPEVYLEPVARQLGFDALLCSQLEWQDERATGRLRGPNCYGEEKVRRLQAWWGEQPPSTLWAYGDTRGDRPMLALADHGIYVGRPAGRRTYETLPPLGPRG